MKILAFLRGTQFVPHEFHFSSFIFVCDKIGHSVREGNFDSGQKRIPVHNDNNDFYKQLSNLPLAKAHEPQVWHGS